MPTVSRAMTIAIAVAMWACAAPATRFESTWKSPELRPTELTGKRIATFYVTPDEGNRRVAEAALARELDARHAHGVPGYTLVPGRDVRDPKTAREELERADIDAAVVMRVVDVDEEVRGPDPGWWRPYPYYSTFWGYWDYGWPMVYDPGYLRTDEVVQVETLVYSVRKNDLVWAARTRTVNPDELDDFVRKLADKLIAKLQDSGVLLQARNDGAVVAATAAHG